MLRALNLPEWKVHELANCRKGAWRASAILNSVLTKKIIVGKLGYLSMSSPYPIVGNVRDNLHIKHAHDHDTYNDQSDHGVVLPGQLFLQEYSAPQHGDHAVSGNDRCGHGQVF